MVKSPNGREKTGVIKVVNRDTIVGVEFEGGEVTSVDLATSHWCFRR